MEERHKLQEDFPMPELKMKSSHTPPDPWLPSFDLHEENGELVLHANLDGFAYEGVEISLDGGEVIVLAESENGQSGPVCHSRLLLPFAPSGLRAICRHGLHEDLEIHIPGEGL
jgi:HSP20 family molecular chaperone IbpA